MAEKKPKELPDVLHDIQAGLKVPKDQWNGFGKYPYRNAESILQRVKELLPDGYSVIMQTRIETINAARGAAVVPAQVIWADATLQGPDGDSLTVSAPALMPDEKKGMDSAQLTGAAISYARKYALAGLFAIDGTKDSDAIEPPQKQQKQQQTQQYAPQEQMWGGYPS